ncbi:TetR/AcrR family transcriptional regulator [Actinoplanes couchii]|uniref:HTH tetR-type domain-containing protein n=1 Tax=Actinoplanes couchii TaxID=403638 RepID=A0ABQ3XMS8_9ACTN|nr:TetR/AcrR family transcriptional regulator [Actinoplanes couchii]MDR6317822.1 AcrR family transcriptional regulator [Actinoplanes couchii]GID59811.1 hypothetical protein Aco03nite_082150 [Actinoplanes couchii]
MPTKPLTLTEQTRRAQLISVTIELIARHHYTGTSLARIAEAAGISKAAVLYHFPSKDAVVQAAYDSVIDAVTAHVGAAVEAATRRPTSDKAESNEAVSGEALLNEAAPSEAPLGEATSGEATLGEATSGEATLGEATSGEATLGEAALEAYIRSLIGYLRENPTHTRMIIEAIGEAPTVGDTPNAPSRHQSVAALITAAREAGDYRPDVDPSVTAVIVNGALDAIVAENLSDPTFDTTAAAESLINLLRRSLR